MLDREDVDLIDFHTFSGSLARAVFDTGVLLFGEPERVETLRERIDTEPDDRSPRERLDSGFERMNDRLA